MPNVKVTDKNFQGFFEKKIQIDSAACLKAARPAISKEVVKLVEGKHNRLIELAEYLVANVTPRHDSFKIFNLLVDSYGFVGRYSDAWESIVKYRPKSVISRYRVYRTVLPRLVIPARALAPPASRNDGQGTSSETVRLYSIFENLIAEYELPLGVSLLEFYARMHDETISTIQKTTGIRFKKYLIYEPDSCTAKDEKLHGKTVAVLSKALQGHLLGLSEKLLTDFESKEDFKSHIIQTVRDQVYCWQQRVFWEETKFLYEYVYDYWTKQHSRKWDITYIYSKKHALRVPCELGIFSYAARGRIYALLRKAENTLRAQRGIRGIGEGWVSESKLVAQLREEFTGVRIDVQAKPSWLGRLRFDAYFPEHKIALEYQGQQHRSAVSLFGGRAGLITTQARDKLKRKLCAENGCRLVEVYPDYRPAEVFKLIRSFMSATQKLEVVAVVEQSPPIPSPPKVTKPKAISKISLGAHDINACARHGTGELIRSLAASGTDFERLQKKKQDSLIFIAASSENLDTLRAFLELGLDVNAPNCLRNTTAIARLCDGYKWSPNLEAVKMLIDAGADLTMCAKGYNVHGRLAYAPPLIGASVDCNLALAKLLVTGGAKIDIRHEPTGVTPFIAACYSGKRLAAERRIEFLRWLLSRGADPLALMKNGHSAFDNAIGYSVERRSDFQLYEYLMRLRIPMTSWALSRIEDDYRVNRTKRLKTLIDYAKKMSPNGQNSET